MESFRINELGVSIINYTTKPIFKNVRYGIRKNISCEDMVGLIRQGYSFSHSFHVHGEYGNKEKTINNFKQTNFIWFDFDDSIDSLDSIYQKLTFKPNISYTTISNLQDGKLNRFRLVYLVDFIIDSNESYKYYLNLLLNTIFIDLGNDYLNYIDNNCFNVSQQMFGSGMTATIITNDKIYNINSFQYIIDNYNIITLLNKGKCSKKLRSNILERERGTLKLNEQITTPISDLITLLGSFDIQTFRPTLTNESFAVLNQNDVYTNVSDQGIYKINFLFDIDNRIRKVKKGHRNNMLFNWGITIRNIKPEITLEELAQNIYWLYITKCEKSDDWNVSRICTVAISVYKSDMSQYDNLGKRKYLIAPEQKHLSRPEKSKALGKARRKTRDSNILGSYDFTKTVKENAKELGISENTVRSSLKDNNIKTSNQEKYDRFVKIFMDNPNATIRGLVKLTGLSDKTIQVYRKRFEGQLVDNW